MNKKHEDSVQPLVPFDFICDTSKASSPVELTTSWLGANIFEGCSYGCVYCFRHRWNQLNHPVQAISISEAYDKLISHAKFEADITPLTANVSSTDAMHPLVLKSTFSLIKRLEDAHYSNPFGIVTKIGIDREHLKWLSELKFIKPIILITYSSMPNSIEPIKKSNRISTIHHANELKLPVILLYKPIVRGWNDSNEAISDVLLSAGKHVNAIVYGGLRLDKDIAKAIRTANIEIPYSIPREWGTKLLPNDINERLHQLHEEICPEVPLYNHTSCAVSSILKKSNYNLLYKTRLIDCSSTCTVSQKRICNEVE